MTPRQRWLALLDGRSADRIPTDYQATEEVTGRLLRDLGCVDEEALYRRLKIDARRFVAPRWNRPLEGVDPEADIWGVRYRRVDDYHGEATVVYGHYSGPRAEWLNNTICLDTGCVYGGSLTALRYPELELVSVPAARTYYESNRSEEFRAAAAELTRS